VTSMERGGGCEEEAASSVGAEAKTLQAGDRACVNRVDNTRALAHGAKQWTGTKFVCISQFLSFFRLSLIHTLPRRQE
jgi:hypothetical protein